MQFQLMKLCVLFAFSICAASAGAAIITVNTLDDEDNTDGDCSLREAVAAANNDAPRDDCTSGSGSDLIFLNVTGTINLSAPIYITEKVELLGTGMDSLTISGQDSTIHFVVAMPNDSHDLKIEDLTLANGFASSNGGSIRILDGGLFKLLNVRFADNHATGDEYASGGALYVNIPHGNDSVLDIEECVFENNAANRFGGALFTTSISTAFPPETIKIRRSVFSNNTADADDLNNEYGGGGGALYMNGVDSVTVTDSLFEGNQAHAGGALKWWTYSGSTAFMVINGSSFIDNSAEAGGALDISFATTLIQNSTFSGNDGADSSNAIAFDGDGLIGIYFTTFYNNGHERDGDSSLTACDDCIVTLNHSIVWTDHEPRASCNGAEGTFQSQGFNIDRDGTCTSDPSDLPMTNPGLHFLDDYGDGAAFVTLPTLLPEEGGAALDGGATDSCPGPFGGNMTDDQRDESRPVAGPAGGTARCDIGAVEYQPGSEPDFAPLEVTLDGSGGGLVVASPGLLRCTDQCVEEYQIGTPVTLSVANVYGDSEFTGWSGGGCSGTGDCEITITGPVTVTATFEQVRHWLKVYIDGNGQVTSTPVGIDCPGTCGAYFDIGTVVSLTATPDDSSSFRLWLADCNGQPSTCELTMDDRRSTMAMFDLVDALFSDRFETP